MDKILVFGHKSPDADTVASAIIMANFENKLGNNAEAVTQGKINKETRFLLNYLGLQEPRIIEDVEDGQNVILVDHNECGQCASNIDNAKILKVIDHHTMCFKAPYQLYYRAEPVGCTATVLYSLYRENDIEIDRTIGILMLSAIISDTLLFKSPTCTEKDEKIARELAKASNIDIESFGMELLKAGTDLSDQTADELINIDAKEFDMNGKKVVIAQVNTANISELMERKEEIENAINMTITSQNLDLFIFSITDIINSNSQAIVLGNRTDIFEKAYNVKLENNTQFLPGVVSRKKQIVPVITENA